MTDPPVIPADKMAVELKLDGEVVNVVRLPRRDRAFNLRMPADLKGILVAAAHENGRSLNAEIIQRLRRSFGYRRDLS